MMLENELRQVTEQGKTEGRAATALAERLTAQVAFGVELAGLHPAEANEWPALLAAALREVHGGVTEASVARAEAIMAPLATAAHRYTVHLVGHAHLDMNFQWSWPETVATTCDTIDTALRLLDEFPEYCFSQPQASVYAILERYRPAAIDRIREQIAAGRWEVLASHWVENDTNLVSAESICRHLLLTRRYMHKLFGLTPADVPIGWAPDSFGHSAWLPTILRQGGVTRYYCCRPRSGNAWQHWFFDTVPPRAFWWEGPDGARLLVYKDPLWYDWAIDPRRMGSAVAAMARMHGLTAIPYVYGAGDHGGGPTRLHVRQALAMRDWPCFPRVVCSPIARFYESLEAQGDRLPVVQGELNEGRFGFDFPGCYTSQSLIKRANRLAEGRLAAAERAGALAVGLPYPAERLREAWRDTLFSQFHDILPGSGVHDTRTYAHGKFQEVAATAGMAETDAWRALAARIETAALAGEALEREAVGPLGAGSGYGTMEGGVSGAGASTRAGEYPFVLFNPALTTQGGVARLPIWDLDPARSPADLAGVPYRVRWPDGRCAAAQVLGGGVYWGHKYADLALPVGPLDALGYRVAIVEEGIAEAVGDLVRPVGKYGLENGVVRLEVDPASGALRELTALASGLSLLEGARPAARLEHGRERASGSRDGRGSAWVIEAVDRWETARVTFLVRTLAGPYVGAIEARLTVGESSLTLRYELRAGEPLVHLHLEAVWRECGSLERGVPSLRLAVPTRLTGARLTCEVPGGAVTRPFTAGEEVPALRWGRLDGELDGQAARLLLLNDGKHGHSLAGDALRLSLIRSTIEPDPLPENRVHTVHLALRIGGAELDTPAAIAAAERHQHPLLAVATDRHEGKMPPEGEGLAVSPAGVVVQALKPADDGDGLILRLAETAGQATTASVRLAPWSIAGAETVDLLERPTGQVRCEGGCVKVPLEAYGLVSVRVRTP